MKTELIQLRLAPTEKEAFRLAAERAGLSSSAWIRSRLRTIAARELESAGARIPFYHAGEK